MRTLLHHGSTVSVGVENDFLVIAHSASAPDRDEWVHVCRALRNHHPTARGLLVLTFGGAPDAAQRKRALDELQQGFVPRPVAVLTESAAVRAVMTALNWLLNDNHRAFAPDNLTGAAQHLCISVDDARSLAAFAHEMMPGTARAR